MQSTRGRWGISYAHAVFPFYRDGTVDAFFFSGSVRRGKSGQFLRREQYFVRYQEAHMREILLFGRILFALVFIFSGFSHFTEPTIGYAASQGVPFAGLLVPLSGLMAIVGGLSVALGYYPKIGAWLIAAFLVPITLAMHAFWTIADPAMAQVQQVMFLKNLSMLGGALAFAYFGSGPYSLASRTPLIDESDTELELYSSADGRPSIGLTRSGMDAPSEESEIQRKNRTS
jgi:putative oxidoreductase